MEYTIHSEHFGKDNDASASSFGWNFQTNAAIFLAINYAEHLEKMKVESSLQDIDITLKNKSKILAQAKSSTDFTKNPKDKQRVYDAFLSLAIAQKRFNNGVFIYVSNIPDFFDSEYGLLNNKVVLFNDLTDAVARQVDAIINNIKAHINKSIARTDDDKKKAKYLYQLECINDFDKTKMGFCVICPYHGDDEKNRYSKIMELLTDFLNQKLKLEDNTVSRIKADLLSYFQNKFEHNSTIKDGDNTSCIFRSDFLWPIVAYVTNYSNEISDKVSELCNFPVDESFLDCFEEAKNRVDPLKCDRFSFISKVLYEYHRYKNNEKICPNIVESFIKNRYLEFVDEFKNYSFEDEMLEFVTKWFVYLVLRKNIEVGKIVTFFGGTGNVN